MFSIEPNANKVSEKLYESEERYQKHFGIIFPLNEYGDTLKGNGYDHSIKGMEKLIKFIDQCIEEEEPVQVPEGYELRDY